MLTIEGSFFPNGRSERRDAVLRVSASGQLNLVNADDHRSIATADAVFSGLEVTPRLGNTPRHLVFSDGSRFETADNDSVDELLNTFQQARGYRLLHRLESHLLLVVLSVLLVAGFVWGSLTYGVPAVASYTAKAIPLELSRYLGQGTLDILDNTLLAPSQLSVQRQQQLISLFDGYTAAYPDLQIKPTLRKGGELGANAMALPDGYIIFTDELVELAQDDADLVAILGHEIGHLVHRHLLRRVIQDSLLSVLVVLISGDVSAASSVVFALPAVLMELAYSREFEMQADDFAYDFLIEHSVDPRHFSDIMRRLANAADSPDGTQASVQAAPESVYLSTHPEISSRIQRFDSPSPH